MQAVEKWVWRRMLRLNWTQRKTNIWVGDKIGVKEEEGLLRSTKRRKLTMYGL